MYRGRSRSWQGEVRVDALCIFKQKVIDVSLLIFAILALQITVKSLKLFTRL